MASLKRKRLSLSENYTMKETTDKDRCIFHSYRLAKRGNFF